VATIPSFSTASAGGTLTAALWNSNVRDAGNFFLGRPHVILTQGVAQAIANTTFTALTWDTEVRDNDAVHSTVTNTSRMTVVTAGWYRVSGTCGWAGSATGQRLSRWAVNGTGVEGTEIAFSSALSTTSAVPAVTADFFLNAGDFVELFVWQNTGGSLNTNIGSTTKSRAQLLWLAQ
jgi:hypothetical protein